MNSISTKAKVGYFLIGMFGFLPGVLASWLIGSDAGSWQAGGKKWAWFGCLFWLIVGPLMSLLIAGIASLAGVAPGETVSWRYEF